MDPEFLLLPMIATIWRQRPVFHRAISPNAFPAFSAFANFASFALATCRWGSQWGRGGSITRLPKGTRFGPQIRPQRLLPNSGNFVSFEPVSQFTQTSKVPRIVGFPDQNCLGSVLFKMEWWARKDSNLQPDRYERSALTN